MIAALLVAACAGRSTTKSDGDAGGTGGAGGGGGVTGGNGSGAVGGSTPSGGGVGGSATGGSGGKGGNGTGGKGGSSSCGPAAIDCKTCNGGVISGICVNGVWTCPTIDCPMPGTGGTESMGGAPSAGGEGGAGDPIDVLEPACRFTCDRLATVCGSAAAPEAQCVDDCLAGQTGVPIECADEAANYVSCLGKPEVCLPMSQTPNVCSDDEWELVYCLLGDLNPACQSRTTMQGFRGCNITNVCSGPMGDLVESSVTCDSEDDGSGISLCDCRRGGEFVQSPAIRAIGMLACAQAAEACDLP